MQAILSILAKLGMSLLTEAVIKRVVVIGAEAVVKRTENPEDDRLVAVIKDAWGL